MRQGLRLRTRWSIGVRLSDLEPMTTLVALTLAGWANADGLGARPSFLSVGKGCRVDRRTVIRHIKKLEEAGWIRRTRGRGVPNRYSLLIPLEIDAKIEATLGEWTGEPVTPQSLPSEELVTLGAPSSDSGSTNQGTPSHPSLTEPDKEQPTSANSPLRGSPTHTESATDGDAPWADHPRGWQGHVEDLKRRIEEEKAAKTSGARVGEAT